MDDEPQEVVLIDEDGRERRFRLHDAFDLDDRGYYLVEAVEDPEEVLLLKDAEGGLETVEGPELERALAVLESDQ